MAFLRWSWSAGMLLFVATVTGAAAGSRSYTNTVGMVFEAVAPGSFVMGSPADEPGRGNDESLQAVVLTQGFWLQRTEVTQRQWQAVMGDNPSHFKQCGNCPVENVSWRDVQRFILCLNSLEDTRAYRLPTEAEWEYACRAGRAEPFVAGQRARRICDYDAQHDRLGWYLENSADRTHPAMAKSPNAWGFYDMQGNVWEWCADHYADRRAQAAPLVDPSGPGFGWGRVFKGGAFNFPAKCSRAANRKWTMEVFASRNIGFRLLREMKAPDE